MTHFFLAFLVLKISKPVWVKTILTIIAQIFRISSSNACHNK